MGVLALVAWLMAALFFVLEVSERRPDPEESKDPQKLQEHTGALAFVRDVMSDAKRERDAVEAYQRRAVFMTGAAMFLTVAVIIGVLVDQPADPSKRGTFTLVAEGQRTVAAACGRPITVLEGTVDPSKLKDEFVPVTVDAGDCQDEKVIVRLRKKHIAAVALKP